MGRVFNTKNRIKESLKARVGGRAASVNNGKSSYPYLSALAFLGAMAFLAPLFFSNSAYADTPTLSFSASSASNSGVVEMETLAPTSTSGAYTSGSDTLSITTTCSAGHSVYVSAASDGGTSLDNTDKTSSIPTGSFTLGSSGLGNVWGIRYGSGNDYIALPAYSSDISGDITPIYTGTNTTIPIYYGINVTPTLAPGEYSGKALYTVLMASECEEEPEPEPTIQDTTTADYCTGSSFECMQDFQCYTLSSGATTTLIDKRDGNTYSVYRIPTDASADNVAGKCFMQSALRLGSELADDSITGSTVKVSEASTNYETAATTGDSTVNNSGNIQIKYVKNTEHSNWSGTNSWSNRQMTWGTGSYDFGYYSWGAALVACPAGWRLPTGNEYGTYGNNAQTTGIGKIVGNSTAGSTALRSQSGAWKFPTYGGYSYSGGWYNQGSRGYYSSATQFSSTTNLDLYYGGSLAYVKEHYKSHGRPVRCIADTFPANTMQGFTCSNLASGGTTTLTDVRDNQTYGVYRIPTNSAATDVAGKCIMTDNLKLGMVAAGEVTGSSDLSLTTTKSNFESGSNDTTISYGSTETVKYVASSNRSSWSSTNDYTNKQYTYGSGNYAFGYYSWGAALVVCPAGWRLPVSTEYGNNTSSWGTSTTGVSYAAGNSGSALMASPWDFKYTGWFYSSGFNYQTWYGHYWTASQTSDTSKVHDWYFNSDGGKLNSNSRSYGRAVRCLAK